MIKCGTINSSFVFRPGDLIWSQKSDSLQHIMVVYKTYSDGSVKIVEANYGGRCHINTRKLSDPHSYINYSSDSYVMTPPSSFRTSSSATPTLPTAPTNIKVSNDGTDVTISWAGVTNAKSYYIYIRDKILKKNTLVITLETKLNFL